MVLPLYASYRCPSNRLQRGVTLIEVMVALVVVSVGILGMAGLQAASLKTTSESGNRGVAARLAYDMSDRLRQDSASIPIYIANATTDLSGSDSSACYSGTGCQGTDRVLAQLSDWQRLLKTQLPGGEGVVCRDATPADGTGMAAPACSGGANDPVVVKIWWRARLTQRDTVGTGNTTTRHTVAVGL